MRRAAPGGRRKPGRPATAWRPPGLASGAHKYWAQRQPPAAWHLSPSVQKVRRCRPAGHMARAGGARRADLRPQLPGRRHIIIDASRRPTEGRPTAAATAAHSRATTWQPPAGPVRDKQAAIRPATATVSPVPWPRRRSCNAQPPAAGHPPLAYRTALRRSAPCAAGLPEPQMCTVNPVARMHMLKCRRLVGAP